MSLFADMILFGRCPCCGDTHGNAPAVKPSRCHRCGGMRIIADRDENDRTFFPRFGCLDCNVWFSKVRLRNP